eukprot:1151391-Pelagomonas_calceolata.AAC.3
MHTSLVARCWRVAAAEGTQAMMWVRHSADLGKNMHCKLHESNVCMNSNRTCGQRPTADGCRVVKHKF